MRFEYEGMMGGGIQPESHNGRVYDQCEAFVYPLRKITGYVLIASLLKKAHAIDAKALYKEDKTRPTGYTPCEYADRCRRCYALAEQSVR